jgi:hypothetical protein
METGVVADVPDRENEHQRSIYDCWHCIMVTQSVMWPLMTIYKVVIGFTG